MNPLTPNESIMLATLLLVAVALLMHRFPDA
jgi:hypothetical protein